MNLQKSGRSKGFKLLHSLFYERGEGYTKEMSSPVTDFDSCSRVSAHLAFGTLLMREVFQTCEKLNQDIKHMPRGEKRKISQCHALFLRTFALALSFYSKNRR